MVYLVGEYNGTFFFIDGPITEAEAKLASAEYNQAAKYHIIPESEWETFKNTHNVVDDE